MYTRFKSYQAIIDIKCFLCGKTFKGVRTGKYCSEKCRRKKHRADERIARKRNQLKLRKSINVKCSICSINFVTNSFQKKYCSRKCAQVALYNLRNEKRKKGVLVFVSAPRFCLVCGKQFTATRRSNFLCSADCCKIEKQKLQAKYRKLESESKRILYQKERTCVICGIKFLTNIYNKIICGNAACKNRRKADTVIAAEKKRAGYIEVHDRTYTCKVCGNKFKPTDARLQICSDKCRRLLNIIRRSKQSKPEAYFYITPKEKKRQQMMNNRKGQRRNNKGRILNDLLSLVKNFEVKG